MGLFSRFKKKVEPVVLAFEDINDWLDKYVERQEIGTTLGILKREIGSKIKKIESLLDDLESSTLKDPSVYPERALGMLVGNKKAYIQKVRNFLPRLEFPEKYEEINPFLKGMSEEIDELAKDTQKNFFVLKEFMEDNVRAVAGKIAELDRVIAGGIETLENSALDLVREIKEKIEEYYATEQETYGLRKKIKELGKTKDTLANKKNKVSSKLESLKSGRGFEELAKLKRQEDVFKHELKSIKSKVSSIFSNLEPAMKKYYNRGRDILVNEYLNDSEKAFFKDKEVKIYYILQKLIKEIDKLELKPAKKSRTEKQIQNLSESELKDMRNKLEKFDEDLKNLSNRIKNHSVKLNMAEQEGWIQAMESDILAQERNIEETELHLERLNLNILKQNIRDSLRKLDSNIDLAK